MAKKLSILIFAVCAALFSTSAFAEETTDTSADTSAKASTEKRVSANGSYEFKPSWGIGIQYGITFTGMDNWSDYLLKPNYLNTFETNSFVADHDLYLEFTPVDGFRISAFGGWQTLYHFEDTGFHYFYGGLEPAWSVRRSFYEFAVGIGIGYGQYWLMNEAVGDTKGHGLLVRPFIEGRLYPCDVFAIYLRLGFEYMKSFGLDQPAGWTGNPNALTTTAINLDKLTHAGPHVAIGIRFGSYPTPIAVVPDSDGDGVHDDVDDCVDIQGSEEFDGCPNPDTDNDGVCDPWVAEKGLSDKLASKCKGSDQCADSKEDLDGFNDEDGCDDPDNDGDGICDPWIVEKSLSADYSNICMGYDSCSEDTEDQDGFEDEDGCPDPDNDRDGVCDPWVAEKGLAEKYLDVCSGTDICPMVAGRGVETGCPNPDADNDGYCESWVYEYKLERRFPHCKGIDKCPFEKGEDAKGCKYRRVEVTADKIQINEAINFDLNKSTIKKDSDSLLEEIAKTFKDNPQIKKVEIQGHTDLSGNAKKNQKLSEDRAKSVYDRLVSLGVEKDRMIHKGYGMSAPVEPLAKGQKKETKEQAAKNRRVVFLILEQDEVKQTILTTK